MNFQQQGKRITIPFGESLPEGIFIGDNGHIFEIQKEGIQ